MRDRQLAEQICRACVDGLDVHGAAISLLTGSPSRETLWASDPTADLLEDLQFTLNEGACMQAASTGSPVLVANLHDSTDAQRWPVFAAAVAEQTDALALFALPLQWGTINLGVLDLYRRTPGGLSPEQSRDAISAADVAALMMLGVRTEPADRDGDGDGRDGDGNGDGDGWLDPAVSGRAEVHQATGMVLVQLDVDAEVALARMRAHAFVEQRLLIDVARDVVSRKLRFTDDMA
ncbi:GAF and ANTAR domain-containing protein [Pseudonocardia charpentierae]|uniref:GAF and ANTAR domain-containing protein n=1 Tax=Pseudonocardia charpentierae TaxID=3075545 RepID=A0ABU2NJP2_9PSEU|nr:GAF and ANTAR domain-containing protein [Pseudonocardia sp. DSM 45834]MDT0353213.1 GAF and ANTAR domain-containing protein [Pseudonocardia sp. DSM 45834]